MIFRWSCQAVADLPRAPLHLETDSSRCGHINYMTFHSKSEQNHRSKLLLTCCLLVLRLAHAPFLSRRIWNQDTTRRACTLLATSKNDGEDTPPRRIEKAMTQQGGYALLVRVGQEQHEEGHTPLIVCRVSVSFV